MTQRMKLYLEERAQIVILQMKHKLLKVRDIFVKKSPLTKDLIFFSFVPAVGVPLRLMREKVKYSIEKNKIAKDTM